MSSAEVHRCLFIKWSDYTCVMHNVYRISTTAFGETLNLLTCGDYNRQGRYCGKCVDGYGPALFSDNATCADCSKHVYFWSNLGCMHGHFCALLITMKVFAFAVYKSMHEYSYLCLFKHLDVDHFILMCIFVEWKAKHHQP